MAGPAKSLWFCTFRIELLHEETIWSDIVKLIVFDFNSLVLSQAYWCFKGFCYMCTEKSLTLFFFFYAVSLIWFSTLLLQGILGKVVGSGSDFVELTSNKPRSFHGFFQRLTRISTSNNTVVFTYHYLFLDRYQLFDLFAALFLSRWWEDCRSWYPNSMILFTWIVLRLFTFYQLLVTS